MEITVLPLETMEVGERRIQTGYSLRYLADFSSRMARKSKGAVAYHGIAGSSSHRERWLGIPC